LGKQQRFRFRIFKKGKSRESVFSCLGRETNSFLNEVIGMSELKVGEQAPDFTLPAVSGETYSLQDDLQQRPGWRYIIYFRGSW
jgi:hypothetical protein